MNDVNSLARAMLRIADDEEFARKIASEAVKVKDKYATDRICTEWEKVV